MSLVSGHRRPPSTGHRHWPTAANGGQCRPQQPVTCRRSLGLPFFMAAAATPCLPLSRTTNSPATVLVRTASSLCSRQSQASAQGLAPVSLLPGVCQVATYWCGFVAFRLPRDKQRRTWREEVDLPDPDHFFPISSSVTGQTLVRNEGMRGSCKLISSARGVRAAHAYTPPKKVYIYILC